MEITTLPLSEICHITVFHGRDGYSLGKSGRVLFGNGKFMETAFSNANKYYTNHKMYKYTKITDSIVSKLYTEAGMEVTGTVQELDSFLAANGVDGDIDKRWIIVPNTSKNLIGKKIIMEFNVGAQDFSYGNEVQELEVFMTPITKTSKSVKFSVYVPKFIYDKCITNPNVEERPKTNYIESDTISTLHESMNGFVSMAHHIWQIERDANNAKKVLCINFSSVERAKKDDYNFGYTGQEIRTSFNFFTAYKTDKGDFFTFDKLQSGMGVTQKGVKGVVNSQAQGKRNWIKYSKIPDCTIEWSQEKEDFLLQLEQQFRTLSDKLNEFLGNLDENKLMYLINNSQDIKLLESQ